MGRLLFQASANLVGFGRVLDALEQESESLWGPRKKGGRAYDEAHRHFEEAEHALKQATVRPREWKERLRDLEKAKEDQRATEQRYAETMATARRLERIKRVAPALARRNELRAQIRDARHQPAARRRRATGPGGP